MTGVFMSENLYSSGQKVLSPEGRERWDVIFREKTQDEKFNMAAETHKRKTGRWGKDNK